MPRTPKTRLEALLVSFLLLLGACGSPQVPAQSSPPPAPEPQSSEAVPATTLEPELARRLDDLASTIESERLGHHLPGLALAIVQDDRLIFARGFGQADVESARAVTPETIFAIGSTTKAFTATLIGILADEGKVAYDDPITEHVPWFELPIRGRKGQQVTLRDLLAHRTGFARMDMLWAGGKASPEEVLRTATRAEPMAPFGKEFLYNNIMFLAAGEACAAVTGEPWEELVRERFFEPLGMRASVTSVAEAQRDSRLALGYRWNEETQAFEHLPMRHLGSIAPAGSINSNVLDMARWVRFLLGRGELEGRRLISLDSFAETWKPHNTMSSGARYGLGWMLHEWRGQPYVEHGGNIDGFAAQVSLLPESGLGLVMLTNVSATSLQGTIGPEVFEALLGKEEEEPPAEVAASEDFARFTGTYIANYFQFHDAPFEVLVKDGRLAIDVPGQMVFELLPPGPDGKRSFALVPEQIQADFEEVDGQVVALRLYQGGMMFDIPREGWVPPPELDPAELEPYLGSYADPLSKKVLAVVISRGRLAVDYPEQMVYECLPPGDDERWVFRATPQMAVEFHLDADDVAESLTFNERGMIRECERVGAGGLAIPTLAELLVLRKAAETEARLAELGLCRLAGTIRFVHCGIEGTTRLLLDARGRLDETTDLRPFVWTRTIFDGERARYWSTLEKERDLTGKSLDQLRGGTAALLGDWSRRYDSALVERVDEASGQRSARVRLVKGEAPPVLVHVDLATGDLLRAEVSEVVDGGGTYAKTLTFEDWRELEGLRLPMRIVSEDDAAGRVVIQYQTLETRVTTPGAPFAFEGIAPPD